MTLTILGSNSEGNGYILHNDTEALVLECGMRFSQVQKALNFNTSKLVAALITHEHGDHSKYISEFEKRGIAIHASAGTFEMLNRNSKNILQHGVSKKIGNFTIIPFNVKHDVKEPIGFFIHHAEMGNVVFATDTYYLPFTFENVNHWMIECNYRKDILDKNCPAGSFKKVLRDRTLESHMSYHTCLTALKANDLSQTINIVLIHLSDGNSNAREFKEGIQLETGKSVTIAGKGVEVNFNKMPF